MKLSEKGLRFIARNEADGGPNLEAYLDTGGVPTIGYGHTHGVKLGDTCTVEQGLQWLHEDAAEAERGVNRLITSSLTQNEYDALVDFVFNIGEEQFETSTIRKLLNDDQHELAALEFRKWRYDNHVEVPGLLVRRVKTKDLFLTP